MAPQEEVYKETRSAHMPCYVRDVHLWLTSFVSGPRRLLSTLIPALLPLAPMLLNEHLSTLMVNLEEVLLDQKAQSQVGTSGLGVKNDVPEKDEVQPVSSKKLPTIVLVPQTGTTFMSNLRFQTFLFPQGNLLPPGIVFKHFLFVDNDCAEILPQRTLLYKSHQ